MILNVFWNVQNRKGLVFRRFCACSKTDQLTERTQTRNRRRRHRRDGCRSSSTQLRKGGRNIFKTCDQDIYHVLGLCHGYISWTMETKMKIILAGHGYN
jgi:hypothetical protein